LCGCDTAAFVEALVGIPGPSIVSLHQTFAVMAVRHRLTLESRPLGHAVTSCRSRALATSWGGKGGPTAAAVQIETLWRQFFSDPSQWWDCRSEKANPRYPGFRNKNTQDALWLYDRRKPPWVGAKLASMAPGAVQLDNFSWNRRLARYVKAGQHEKTVELFREMLQMHVLV